MHFLTLKFIKFISTLYYSFRVLILTYCHFLQFCKAVVWSPTFYPLKVIHLEIRFSPTVFEESGVTPKIKWILKLIFIFLIYMYIYSIYHRTHWYFREKECGGGSREKRPRSRILEESFHSSFCSKFWYFEAEKLWRYYQTPWNDRTHSLCCRTVFFDWSGDSWQKWHPFCAATHTAPAVVRWHRQRWPRRETQLCRRSTVLRHCQRHRSRTYQTRREAFRRTCQTRGEAFRKTYQTRDEAFDTQQGRCSARCWRQQTTGKENPASGAAARTTTGPSGKPRLRAVQNKTLSLSWKIGLFPK